MKHVAYVHRNLATEGMAANNWPRTGIGDGGYCGGLVFGEGEGSAHRTNCWTVGHREPAGGRENDRFGKNWKNEHSDRKQNAETSLLYNVFTVKQKSGEGLSWDGHNQEI